MSIPSQSNAENEAEEEENSLPPYHHPYAPPDELFDVLTTVDPSYIISLIRKLVPPSTTSSIVTRENGDKNCDTVVLESEGECMEEGGLLKQENEVLDVCNDEHESMEVNTFGEDKQNFLNMCCR